MSSARQYVDQFSELFQGNKNVHGVHIPEKEKVEGKKAKGESFTKTEPVTDMHYLKHLFGEESLGIVPVDENGETSFGAIDIDVYPTGPQKYISAFAKAKLPFVPFKTKSGGLHLMCFFSKPTSAAHVISILQDVRDLLGLPKDTEIFPKQTRIMPGKQGNWINLPYFKYNEPDRYAYDLNGQPLSIGDALNYCSSSRVDLKTFQTIMKEIPMSTAPPCLQTIFMLGGATEGHRNLFLFNCAVFLKAKFGKDFATHLHDLNRRMDKPIAYEELDRTVISSHNKGDYSYQCNEGLLSEYCNKESCDLRAYGKETGVISDLTFEQLIQVNSATPYYKWYVNGAEMVFFSEAELMNQAKFRELCLRLLHTVPNTLKANAWNNILNRALKNIKIEEVEAVDDLSDDSLWVSKVTEFFTRRKAMRPSQVEDGLVWHAGDNILHFKGAKILEFLEKTRMFHHFKKTQHRDLLKQLGAVKTKLRYSDVNKTGRTWRINLDELHKDGLFLDVKVNDAEFEENMEPLDFIGEEKF